ncbi:hemagglutinin, partial [Xanthomonas citri pv. citri]
VIAGADVSITAGNLLNQGQIQGRDVALVARRTPILSSTSVLESNSPGDLDMTLPIRTALVEL